MKVLIVVESPAKIAKFKSFLGKDYNVEASKGIFRDLSTKGMSIDFQNNFEPIYVVTKPDVVANLKNAFKGMDMLYIASDLDYEGDGIAQSIYDTLKPKQYKRLIFNSITKEAILNSIEKGGTINTNHVNAQKTRRVLDRLYGYLISPVLQKQMKGKLSAGRVQSVTARIVVEKENEINEFIEKDKDAYFRINGIFSGIKAGLIQSEKHGTFKGSTAMIPLPNENATNFLKKCLKSTFTVHSVDSRISLRNPSPPFITSTLQQEANRKLGMPIDVTMKTAQKLYEAGHITYMRTDSVDISAEGHAGIKKTIIDMYGDEYYQKNVYQNKSSSSQEAHEAIRPVHPENQMPKEITDTYQQKLYRLIWQRTIASQMKPAKINVTTIQISISMCMESKDMPFYFFQTEVEEIVFPGFMKVYIESKDEEEETKQSLKKIPKKNTVLIMEEINAKQEYQKPPSRYTQASLVKKLEELGIGRPSTYVNTINTIIEREYIRVGDIAGTKKDITNYKIISEKEKHVMKIFEENETIQFGQEKNKLIPTELGKKVTAFLMEYFTDMMDYGFTARMEAEMDDVAEGKKVWHVVVKKFYDQLNPVVEKVSKMKMDKPMRIIGKDKDGNEMTITETKYGPVVMKTIGDKKIYAKIKPPLSPSKITLEQAIKLFEYPKILGSYKGHDVLLYKGSYGLFLSYNKQRYSVSDTEDIELKRAIEVIESKNANVLAEYTITENNKKIKVIALKGPYGNYIQVLRGAKKTNYTVPESFNPSSLSEDDIKKIMTVKRTRKSIPQKGGSGSKKTYRKK